MKLLDLFCYTKSGVYIDNSNIKNGGKGLFAKKYFSKGTPIVVYYGDKVTDEEIFQLYIEDKDAYFKLNKYIRGTPNGFAIKGDREQKNLNLSGVYVNDISCINCKKEEINQIVLMNYAQSAIKCNLKTVDTSYYPIYVSTKRIKKGEELYAHYGLGYWLSHIGCSPEEISDLNEKYPFSNFYS